MRERRSKPEGGRETETESDKTRRKETKGDGERARGRKADGDRGGKFFIPTPMASAGRSSDAIGTQDRHVVHLSRERSASLWTSGRIRGHTSSDQNSIRSRPSARARAVKFPSYSPRVSLYRNLKIGPRDSLRPFTRVNLKTRVAKERNARNFHREYVLRTYDLADVHVRFLTHCSSNFPIRRDQLEKSARSWLAD